MNRKELRKRAAELIENESRFATPPALRCFLVGLAAGLALAAYLLYLNE